MSQTPTKQQQLDQINLRFAELKKKEKRANERVNEYGETAFESLKEGVATTRISQSSLSRKSRLEELIDQLGQEGVRDRFNDQKITARDESAPSLGQALGRISASERKDQAAFGAAAGETSASRASRTLFGQSSEDIISHGEGMMQAEHRESLLGKRGAALAEHQQRMELEQDLFDYRRAAYEEQASSGLNRGSQSSPQPSRALRDRILEQTWKDGSVAAFFDESPQRAGKLNFDPRQADDKEALISISRHRDAMLELRATRAEQEKLEKLSTALQTNKIAPDDKSLSSAVMSSRRLSPRTEALLAQGLRRAAPSQQYLDQLAASGQTASSAINASFSAQQPAAQQPIQAPARAEPKSPQADALAWLEKANPPGAKLPEVSAPLSSMAERARARQEQAALAGQNPDNIKFTVGREQGSNALAEARKALQDHETSKSLAQSRDQQRGLEK